MLFSKFDQGSVAQKDDKQLNQSFKVILAYLILDSVVQKRRCICFHSNKAETSLDQV